MHRAPFAVVVAAATAAMLALALTGPLQRVEWSVYDAFMRIATRGSEPAPRVVVVAIDEPSFAEIALPWPWPRALHARLVDQIAAQRPAAIVFDIVFEGPGAAPEGNAQLAAAMEAAGNVVLAADRAPIDDRRYSVVQWSEPETLLASAAAGIGAATIPMDPDGRLRSAVFVVDGRPSLVAAAAPLSGNAAPNDERPRLTRYNGAPRSGIETVSYYQALDAARSLPPAFFRDKVVFVGRALRAPAGNEADHYPTPVSPQMAGVEVHATIADALMRGRFVADPFASRGAVVLLAIGFAALSALIVFVWTPGGASLAIVLLAVVLVAAGYGALAHGNIRVPVVTPLLAIVAAHSAGAAYRFTLTGRERALIKRAFTHFVAPAIVEQMLADPSRLKLGGEERDVTVLFSDLEGFTTLSERLTPAALTAHLTGYFRDMIDRLLAERATLDKLIGDSIMVYFGCPIAEPEHAVRACRAALAMQERMAALNEQWSREGLPRLRTRIGINSGTVVAGNMGTDTIFNFTVIGDAVNLASRLEGVNKEYGTLIIVGEDTWTRVASRFEGRQLDWIRVKGKERPVAIYELASVAGQLSAPRRALFEHYAGGLSAYREARWADAAARFDAALRLDPSDGPSRTLATRCARFLGRGTPSDWDGVYDMLTK